MIATLKQEKQKVLQALQVVKNRLSEQLAQTGR
jgi:hypothetical protein